MADSSLLFALRVLLPDIRITTRLDDGGPVARLHDGRSSWATIATTDTEDGPAAAAQGGPRRLADEITCRIPQHLTRDRGTLERSTATRPPAVRRAAGTPCG
ncbi:hypothetical protein ACIHCQ_17325 [Streptomyces sp. NPDC052236]|uniref:hypothetical protein n=1 Tax=Streptomyces sp. NPDC052236 TaxID=3365686 RepID=UPI0037D7FD51